MAEEENTSILRDTHMLNCGTLGNSYRRGNWSLACCQTSSLTLAQSGMSSRRFSQDVTFIPSEGSDRVEAFTLKDVNRAVVPPDNNLASVGRPCHYIHTQDCVDWLETAHRRASRGVEADRVLVCSATELLE